MNLRQGEKMDENELAGLKTYAHWEIPADLAGPENKELLAIYIINKVFEPLGYHAKERVLNYHSELMDDKEREKDERN